MTRATIDPAQPRDSAAVVALFAEDLTALRLPVDLDTLGEVFSGMLADPRAVVLVCREQADGEAEGVLVASRMLSVKHGGRSLWIEELYVGASHRGKGYGRALVEGLLDLAKKAGIKGIDLESYQGNDTAALLYRSVGFRRLGRERFNYHLDWDE
ncbi:MAG: GNAT family N-acetyltransferase [Myxococcales bacterium]|nr:GNAT family N-acetyltransferase [Myxococcales bacterium]